MFVHICDDERKCDKILIGLFIMSKVKVVHFVL